MASQGPQLQPGPYSHIIASTCFRPTDPARGHEPTLRRVTWVSQRHLIHPSSPNGPILVRASLRHRGVALPPISADDEISGLNGVAMVGMLTEPVAE
jgi:hypothetical protein